jgi:hypothetical protein
MMENKTCDFNCGRPATLVIGHLNLCAQCADEHDYESAATQKFEDVISPIFVPLRDDEVL